MTLTQTQIKNGWKVVKLGGVVTFNTGKLNSNAAVVNGEHPFFTCSQEIYKTNTFSFDTECVLLGGNNASAVYPIFYFNGKFDAYQRTYVIRPKEKDVTRYFYYILKNKLEELRTSSTGATTKFLTLKILENLEIILPTMSTQEKIANVLSAYDDLTENNDKRIKVLEAMAQKLYTEWFVNFKFPRYKKVKMVASGHPDFGMVPEGWEVKSIGEIVKVKKGKNITKDTVSIGSVPVVAGGLEPAYYHNIANAKGPVITISASGANAGFINLYHQDIWASDCSYMNKDLTDFVFFFYLFLKINQGKIFDLQRGSAQPHVYPKDIMSLNFIYPTQTILKDFESIVKSYFIQVANLQKQNLNLKKSRDFLIPQLVGGRVEVK